MPKRLKRAIHDLTNTIQVILSAIEEREYEMAMKAAQRGVKQLEELRKLIEILRAEFEERDRDAG